MLALPDQCREMSFGFFQTILGSKLQASSLTVEIKHRLPEPNLSKWNQILSTQMLHSNLTTSNKSESQTHIRFTDIWRSLA